MSLPPRLVKVATGAVLLGWLVAVVLVLRGYLWPLLCTVEEPTLRAMLDPRLYTHDFAVQEWLRFTPRSYYNFLLVGLAHAGLSLAAAAVTAHAVALAVLLTGLRALARALDLGGATAATLLLWILNVTVGAIGGVFLYTHAPLPAVWATGVIVWGAALALRQNWPGAYACFAVAAVLQFLVGFYAGLIFLPSLPWRETRVVARALAVWALGLLATYAPLVALGSMGTPLLANDAFVEIYARLRHPNHLVPSTWGWPAWAQFLAFYAGGLLCLRELASTRPPRETRPFLTALALAAGGLVINYFFVELRPWALVAKLQPARLTPLAELALLAALALVIQRRYVRRDYGAALLLGVIPLTPLPGFLLAGFALLLPPAEPRPRWRWGLCVVLLLAVYQIAPFTARLALHYAGWLALFGAAWLVDRCAPPLAPSPRLHAVGAAVAALTAVAWFLLPAPPRQQLAPRFAVAAHPVDAPGWIGLQFRHTAPPDALVLVPPDGDSWSFRLFARCAVVVEAKNMPFTDRGMLEWKRRIEEVLGRPFTRGLDLEKVWSETPAAHLVAVAAHQHAGYLLTRDVWHPDIPGAVRVDRVADWSLWRFSHD